MTTPPDFSDIPTSPNGMYDIGKEGQTPADVVSTMLGDSDFKDDPDLQVLFRTNWEPHESTIIMRVLIVAKYGLGLIPTVKGEWRIPWLKQAVVNLGAARCSTNFHMIDTAEKVLSKMQTKTEQQIRMSQV